MKEVLLEGLAPNIQEATVRAWYFEEGDAVNEGDELVEMTTEDGDVILSAPKSGVLAEVYYDEGESVGKGEVLCSIDDEEELDDDPELD